MTDGVATLKGRLEDLEHEVLDIRIKVAQDLSDVQRTAEERLAAVEDLLATLKKQVAEQETTLSFFQTRPRPLSEDSFRTTIPITPRESDVDYLFIQQNLRTLKQWTAATKARVAYDSAGEEFSAARFFARAMHRPNIAIIAFTTNDDVFGGYTSAPVTATGVDVVSPDHFIFSLFSHGRCPAPTRWFLKPAFAQIFGVSFKEDPCGFVVFGFTNLWIGGPDDHSVCSSTIDDCYDNIRPDAITGTFGNNPAAEYHCRRVLVLRFYH